MRISGLAITLLLATALAPPMAAAQQPLPRPGQDIPLPAPQGQRPAPVQQAPAQQAPAQQAGPQQPAPPKPYKPVAVQLPAPIADHRSQFATLACPPRESPSATIRARHAVRSTPADF